MSKGLKHLLFGLLLLLTCQVFTITVSAAENANVAEQKDQAGDDNVVDKKEEKQDDTAAQPTEDLSATSMKRKPAQPTGNVGPDGKKKKLTRQEMEALAAKLDKQIFHLSHDDFAKGVAKDTWLVFWGAKWCKFCQRLTPKWHKLQSRIYEKLNLDYRFYVAKVDCTEDEDFCGKYGVDAYPTIILYNKGKPIEEYSSEIDVNSMFQYAKAMARKYYEYKTDEVEHDEL